MFYQQEKERQLETLKRTKPVQKSKNPNMKQCKMFPLYKQLLEDELDLNSGKILH